MAWLTGCLPQRGDRLRHFQPGTEHLAPATCCEHYNAHKSAGMFMQSNHPLMSWRRSCLLRGKVRPRRPGVFNLPMDSGMTQDLPGTPCHFLSYTGVQLPFRLITPLADAEVANRNTYFTGYFDAADCLLGFDKWVYGEVELAHRYAYHAGGILARAEITDIDGEVTVLEFDSAGQPC